MGAPSQKIKKWYSASKQTKKETREYIYIDYIKRENSNNKQNNKSVDPFWESVYK